MSDIVSAGTRRAPKFINARVWPPQTRSTEIMMSDSRQAKRRISDQAPVEINAAKNTKAKNLPAPSRVAWLPDMDTGKARRAKLLVAGVEALVLKSLPERLSEAFFAQTFGIEIRELHAAFLKVRGVGLYTALRTLRIAEVKRRLDANKDLSVDRVMRECGFASYAWFRKEFLERFKVDPKIYRKSSPQNVPDSGNAKRTKARDHRNVRCGMRSVN